jgi:hypothetical protein
MTDLNPITGSILQAPLVQQLRAADKSKQLRRTLDIEKNAAAPSEEETEESVASAEELSAAGKDSQKQKQNKGNFRSHHSADDEEHPEGERLDLRA